MFFLQMSGFPGSGKSTLARELAKLTGAVLVDHDVVKSALLEKADSSIDPKVAGQMAYQIDWALVQSNLSLGHSVILDSPCLYEVMIVKGESLAHQTGAQYKYIECYLEDYEEINNRLKKRVRMPSQISHAPSEKAFQQTLANSKKPNHPYLILDTSKPLESYLEVAHQYLID